jgi:sulfur carrier protein ThiS
MTAVLHPFKVEQKRMEFEEGITLQEMVEQAQPDKKQVRHATAFVKGRVIPRDQWHTVKPLSGDLVEVRAYPVPMGGGGGGEKDVLRTVAMIAVMAVAVMTGQWWALGQAGTTLFAVSSAVIAAVVTTVGMLAVNALIPIKQPKLDSLSSTSGTTDSPTLFINGARNSLSPFSPVPQVLGKYRSTPPLGSKPYTEIIGDKQFIRMLFVWGIGPLSIDLTSLKIGETPISEFEGVKMEHREGYDTDEPFTLFPSAINQQDFTVLLSYDAGWISRTSTVYADELGIDITFPYGLVEYDDVGARAPASVTLEIEYREAGSSPWLKIDTTDPKFQTTANAEWLNKSGSDLNSVTFTQSRTSAIRHGIRWAVSSRGQYEIRMRRTSADTSSTQIYDVANWTALRTITNDDPINSPVPVAATALVIQATDQLNGIVDQFNGLVTTVCMDWDAETETWIERATQNPASLFRHVLQGNAMANPMADARLDLDTLQDWHEFCDEKGFTFNMIRDFQGSVWDVLADVAAAGRAAPTQIDGKWSVAIDRPQATPVSYITPRNSFDFKAQKFFLNAPHGFRIQFPNEDEGYTFDERRVYRDGYDDGNATVFESLELPGVTDPDQIYRLGRFRLAQALNQPERWSFGQDMEFMTYRRGQRVTITHDVILVGLYFGRIKGLVLDGADVTGIELDEEITMEAGKTYGVIIRTLENPSLSAQVDTVAGTSKSLTFTEPVSGIGSPAEAAIAIGNMFGFGIFGEESDDALIISQAPSSNLKAQMIAVPYREAIYTADTETIPEFVTKITPLVEIPAPTIKNIVSDESAMVISSTGTLKVRIGIGFNPLNKELFGVEPELRVQMRPSSTAEPYAPAFIEEMTAGHVFIGDVRTGEEWDIRLRFVVPGRLPGPWTTISSHRVVGRSTAPSPLSNMTISVFGAQAMIRWDKPAELDVLFGGEVVFRHSSLSEGATWGGSVTIGQSARARTLFAVLPLKPGTYLARVYDVDGTPSEEVTTVTTKQASVHEFVNVNTLDEASSFLGTHDNTEEDAGNLRLTEGSPRVLTGTYTFANGFDFLTVSRVRLTTRIAVAAYNISDTVDGRTDPIDSWEDFDGVLQAGGDARIFVRHTDDDPEGSPLSWSQWERLDSAEFEARAFQFKVELTVDSQDYNIVVSELGIDADQIA